MKEYDYLLIIIFLSIFVILYGGHNNQNLIEYDSYYFQNFDKIILFENKLQVYNTKVNFESNDFIDLDNYVKLSKSLIPNLENLYFINIKPHSFYNIEKIFDNKLNRVEYLMIIFNHNKSNNLELLLGKDTDNNGYFYDLVKKITITGIFNLYNNSNDFINVSIFFIKKPFWF
jgi:hypothetical protein